MTSKSILGFSALLLVILLYISVRLWDLAATCLWFDEIFSVHAAEHSWNSLISFVALDLIHPPLFYILLKLWMTIGGDSVFWLRLFPVGFSIIAVFPFLALCRELKLPIGTQILALFLLACNGSMIKYAQEVRMYSLLFCLSLFSMSLFARYFFRGKSLAGLIVINVLLVHAHYFGWFVVGAEALTILWMRKVRAKGAVLMVGLTAASFLPWLAAVLQAARSGTGLSQNIGWMSRPGFFELASFATGLIEPFYYRASSAEPLSMLRISIPLLALAAVAGILYLTTLKKIDRSERETIRLLGCFIILPLLAAFSISWLSSYSIWGTRHLIIVFAPLSILLAIILLARSSAWMPMTAATIVIVFSGYAWSLKVDRPTPQYSWCAWEPLLAASTADKTPVYTVEDLVAYHLWFPERKQDGTPIVKLFGIEGTHEDTAYFLPRGFDHVRMKTIAEVNEPRVKVAVRGVAVSESESPLRDLVVKGYRITGRTDIRAGVENLSLVTLEN